jgi:hypothetical protein
MKMRFVGPLAAATLAVGVVAGAAGTITAHSVTNDTMPMAAECQQMAAQMANSDMSAMHAMMSSMGGGMGMPNQGTMPMMDPGHAGHHPPPSPAAP